MNDLISYQSGLKINSCTRRLRKCLCHTRVVLSFMENSHIPVLISYIYQILIPQLATMKKTGQNKSSVSLLILTAFCIYTRLQIHVSVPGGVGIYIYIGIQVDTDNLITYHTITWPCISFNFINKIMVQKILEMQGNISLKGKKAAGIS